MPHQTKRIIDRQIGRNAELFARAITEFDTPAARYPYLRILISIIEQAHPEWQQVAHRDRQIAFLASQLSDHLLDMDEIAEVVRVRDQERGYFYDSVTA